MMTRTEVIETLRELGYTGPTSYTKLRLVELLNEFHPDTAAKAYEKAGDPNFIEAVRSDKLVGRGTCSVIDECYTDEELLEVIAGARSEAGAVRKARARHNLWAARQADCY